MCRYLNICGDITDDGLMWMLWVIKKNLKPARHPDATSVDDHDEGDNFINIEDEEEEIDQVEIDETGDSDGQRRKNVDLTTLREKQNSLWYFLLL
ncbi:hypothetical protein D0Y65_029838 [Glycine soja]|uniref:Uncharacterized protein n=2 Tax=Glycine subgen. Soja TaxID=1462606 RepID=K7LPL1_SOYBN|nr:hypothetical protein D0Y65_029838 [Glycine soja]